MRRRPGDSPVSATLTNALDAWTADCVYRRLTDQTVNDYRRTVHRLRWWLSFAGRRDDIAELTVTNVREFVSYAGAPNPSGRWGNPHATRPAYTRARHEFVNLRAFSLFRGQHT